MIFALDGTAISVSIITTMGVVIVGWFGYQGIKAQVNKQTDTITSNAKENAAEAAAKVNAHLDNGLHTTLKRLDSRLEEQGIMVSVIVKTQDKPIFKTDPSGALVSANPAAVRLLGMTVAEMTGDGWVRAIHPEDRQRVFREWFDCVAHRREFGPMIYRYLHPTTKEVTMVEAVATPCVDMDGDVLSWVATLVPISDF